jgi:hypothetical protein
MVEPQHRLRRDVNASCECGGFNSPRTSFCLSPGLGGGAEPLILTGLNVVR